MRQLKIGILGATGLVGQAMLECIEKLQLPFSELRLFASSKSIGKMIHFLGNDYKIEMMTQSLLEGLDVLFGAVDSNISKKMIDMIKTSGVLYIDNSSAFRLDENVPLVIPEININDIKDCHRIIANPNCSTILTLMAAAPVHKLFGLKRMIVSTYQAVSGAGKNGMDELEQSLIHFPKEIDNSSVFHQPIINNVIALIGDILQNGYTTEEMKMENESRKIMHLPEMEVTCTCVRVPVLRSHCISIYCETEKEVRLDALIEEYYRTSGVSVLNDLPSPYTSSNHFEVQIGRIRKDNHTDKAVLLWCSGDQIYKGAALNAVQIAQSLLLK